MALTGFTRDHSHSLATAQEPSFSSGWASVPSLGCAAAASTPTFAVPDLLDGLLGWRQWIWLAYVNFSEGHWTAGTTWYCQQPCSACRAQVPRGWGFLGEGSVLLLVGSLWLLAHLPRGAAPLLEDVRDPEHMGCGSPTADRALVSDPVHHCRWTSAKGPLHTSLLNTEKTDDSNSGVAVNHRIKLFLVHSW